MMQLFQTFLGMGVIVLAAVLLSRSRATIPWRAVGMAFAGQAALGALFLHVEWASRLLGAVTYLAKILEQSTVQGTAFVFGYIGGGTAPFEVLPGSSSFVFAFQILPVVLVVGAISALLVHWRVLGPVVATGAWILRKTIGVTSPVGFAAVANAFLGMIEAPLLIKPYLARLHPNELFTVMAVGMSTVAGGTAIVISGIVADDPQIFGNVITATLMNVLGAIGIAMILFPSVPETGAGGQDVRIASPYRSSMEALVTGTTDGAKIFLSVVSLLIVFIALVAMIDAMLGLVHDELSLTKIFGVIFAPITWLLGIGAQEAVAAGEILGAKVAVNELVAYTALAESGGELSAHTRFVLTFALCGFGNFGSVAILIGGLSAMAPERFKEIVGFGLWALVAAFLTNCLTAAIASAIG
ncbi:MAG: nucleoside:proton symporter [Gammaproteobacteria bacterium]|nr:nucleoside:proton symporter [Chromatiales bacterium]MYE48350.1 nucleoside:proton symporter [Gammaproteobacteria bacterium]MYF23834.1 nucleoside:proton symporter [Nitrospira sp. SB0678_bin_10]